MDDLISREQAIRACTGMVRETGIDETPYEYAGVVLCQLPAVAIPSKVGRWKMISPAAIYECSECGQHVMTQDICAYHYCHGCGAKMGGEQE